MIHNYPYYNIPYYNGYSRYGYSYNNINGKTAKKEQKNEKENIYVKSNETKKEESDDSPIFQIFGISLYFDDILLICLIFFLYEEGVKDDILFVILILLLLS